MPSEKASAEVDIQQRVGEVKLWRHRITLPDGSVTPGSQDTLAQLPSIGLPEDLSGKTVLDIGCSDGFFSFECERRGASRVLAVDNFSSVYVDSPAGFMVARDLLGSKVEFLESDLFQLEPGTTGKFDLVLFLGVLYHLRHPLLALDHLVKFCSGQIIVETEVIRESSGLKADLSRRILGRTTPAAYMEFLEDDSLNHDPTSWWKQSSGCVEGMLRSCGLCGVKMFSNEGTRGVFHGFTPKAGGDVNALVDEIGADVVSRAVRSVLGEDPRTNDLGALLRGLSVEDFGAVRQRALELRAKHWHQVERWK